MMLSHETRATRANNETRATRANNETHATRANARPPRVLAAVGTAVSTAIGTALLAAMLAPADAHAQSWPQKPIRWVVPFAAGGMTDILGRVIGPKLTEALGQPIVIDNKPGAGGGVGAAEVAKSAPDGYTIMGGTISSHAINVTLYSKLPYDAVKDFAPITMLVTLPNMLVVHPSIPANSIRELIAVLKANPNKYSFASSGNGTSQHISGELFKTMTGTQMQHIPYRGSGPLINDLIAGQVHMSFDNITTALPHARGGRLRALGVTTAKRSGVAPDVPTIAESGVAGYDLGSWQGVFAPAGTPRDIVARLNTEIVRALRSPDVQKRLTDLGCEIVGNTPEEFAALISADIPRLGKVVRDSGARVD